MAMDWTIVTANEGGSSRDRRRSPFAAVVGCGTLAPTLSSRLLRRRFGLLAVAAGFSAAAALPALPAASIRLRCPLSFACRRRPLPIVRLPAGRSSQPTPRNIRGTQRRQTVHQKVSRKAPPVAACIETAAVGSENLGSDKTRAVADCLLTFTQQCTIGYVFKRGFVSFRLRVLQKNSRVSHRHASWPFVSVDFISCFVGFNDQTVSASFRLFPPCYYNYYSSYQNSSPFEPYLVAACLAVRSDQLWKGGICLCAAAGGNRTLSYGGPAIGGQYVDDVVDVNTGEAKSALGLGRP